MQEANETCDLVGFSNQSDIRSIIMGNDKSTYERFKDKIKVSDDGCWLWTGYKNLEGYGRFWVEGKTPRAHRWSYQYHIGEIPEGLYVCHKCDIPSCVNPDCLWIGTHKQNMEDRNRKGRQAKQKGVLHGNCLLTEKAVVLIKQFFLRHPPKQGSRYSSGTFLARWFGVTGQAIRKIRQGKKWKHIEVTE